MFCYPSPESVPASTPPQLRHTSASRCWVGSPEERVQQEQPHYKSSSPNHPPALQKVTVLQQVTLNSREQFVADVHKGIAQAAICNDLGF